MKTSENLTVTDARLRQALSKEVNQIISNTVPQQIQKVLDDNLIRTGVVTKFYHYQDKAEVKLDNSNKIVLCKCLHRFGGELIDFFTPTADEEIFDDNRKEPCIIPRGNLHCVVMNIHDLDSDEHLILGYYQNEELVGINPATPGNMKIVTRGGTNQFWIKFGYDGLDIRSITPTTINVGEMDDEMENIEYITATDLENIIDLNEVYNQLENLNNEIINLKDDSSNLNENLNIDLNSYVKKSDVDLKFDLMTNGYIIIGLNVGDGF